MIHFDIIFTITFSGHVQGGKAFASSGLTTTLPPVGCPPAF
jgi:hypothetical protein